MFQFGTLLFEPVEKHVELVAKPLQKAIVTWKNKTALQEILITEIDPEYSDSLAFCAKYQIDPTQTANCLIVEARRGSNKTYAACLIPVSSKANINTVVRKFLTARSVSFASREFATLQSQMEFGGISIIGLPDDWSLLVDEQLLHIPKLLIGSGLRKSKLLLPGNLLKELPNVHIINGLSSLTLSKLT